MCPPAFLDQLRRRYHSHTSEGSGGVTRQGLAPSSMVQFTELVDLTHTLTPEFPTYSGVSELMMEDVRQYGRDRLNLKRWTLYEHIGTHIDAPLHFSLDGSSVDEIPLQSLVVPLVVIDIAGRAEDDPDTELTPQDIAAWESTHGPIPAYACVAMNSGWDRHAESPRFRNADSNGLMHFPGFHVETVLMLLARKISGVAVDTLSIDRGRSSNYAVHYSWLPSGRWALEGLAHLADVPARGATLVVGAPKLKGATGGPSRVLALV
jgi:kynurenine formamidase